MPAPSAPSLSDRLISALNELLRAEVPAVSLLAAVAPWLAPIFPAAYTWHNVSFVMLFGWNGTIAAVVGGFVAASVEAVGIAAVHTIISLWGKEKADGLVKMAGGALGMYLLIVVGANVALDWNAKRDGVLIAASGLLCLMTVTGGIIAGVRARAARAAADEQAKQDSDTAQANAAIAEDSRQFDKEQLAWKEKGEREERMQKEANAHAERMAKIAKGIDPDAPPAPPPPTIHPVSNATPNPRAPRRPKPTYSMDHLREWVGENDKLSADKQAIGLKAKFGALNKDIAEVLQVHASTVGRWISENGDKQT